MAIGFISLQYVRSLHLSASKAYAIIALAIIVPPGEEYGDIEKFVRPFSVAVWIAIYTTTALAVIVIFLVSHSSQTVYNFVIGRHVKTPMHNMVAIITGVSQARLPTRNFARFILMIFILF